MSISGLDLLYNSGSTAPVRTEYSYTFGDWWPTYPYQWPTYPYQWPTYPYQWPTYPYQWPYTISVPYTSVSTTHYHCERCNVSIPDGRLCVACSLLKQRDQLKPMRAEDV